MENNFKILNGYITSNSFTLDQFKNIENFKSIKSIYLDAKIQFSEDLQKANGMWWIGRKIFNWNRNVYASLAPQTAFNLTRDLISIYIFYREMKEYSVNEISSSIIEKLKHNEHLLSLVPEIITSKVKEVINSRNEEIKQEEVDAIKQEILYKLFDHVKQEFSKGNLPQALFNGLWGKDIDTFATKLQSPLEMFKLKRFAEYLSKKREKLKNDYLNQTYGEEAEKDDKLKQSKEKERENKAYTYADRHINAVIDKLLPDDKLDKLKEKLNEKVKETKNKALEELRKTRLEIPADLHLVARDDVIKKITKNELDSFTHSGIVDQGEALNLLKEKVLVISTGFIEHARKESDRLKKEEEYKKKVEELKQKQEKQIENIKKLPTTNSFINQLSADVEKFEAKLIENPPLEIIEADPQILYTINVKKLEDNLVEAEQEFNAIEAKENELAIEMLQKENDVSAYQNGLKTKIKDESEQEKLLNPEALAEYFKKELRIKQTVPLFLCNSKDYFKLKNDSQNQLFITKLANFLSSFHPKEKKKVYEEYVKILDKLVQDGKDSNNSGVDFVSFSLENGDLQTILLNIFVEFEQIIKIWQNLNVPEIDFGNDSTSLSLASLAPKVAGILGWFSINPTDYKRLIDITLTKIFQAMNTMPLEALVNKFLQHKSILSEIPYINTVQLFAQVIPNGAIASIVIKQLGLKDPLLKKLLDRFLSNHDPAPFIKAAAKYEDFLNKVLNYLSSLNLQQQEKQLDSLLKELQDNLNEGIKLQKPPNEVSSNYMKKVEDKVSGYFKACPDMKKYYQIGYMHHEKDKAIIVEITIKKDKTLDDKKSKKYERSPFEKADVKEAFETFRNQLLVAAEKFFGEVNANSFESKIMMELGTQLRVFKYNLADFNIFKMLIDQVLAPIVKNVAELDETVFHPFVPVEFV